MADETATATPPTDAKPADPGAAGAAAAGGTGSAAPGNTGATAPPADPAGTGGGTGAGATGAGDAAKTGDKPADAPHPWANLLDGLDDKLKGKASERLGRYKSGADIAKAILAGDSMATELAELKKTPYRVPGKDAKPEDIAAYHKAIGVPEKPEDYQPYRPEGRELNPIEIEMEKSYLASMHKSGVPQVMAEANLRAYYEIQDGISQKATVVAKQMEAEAETHYRSIYGSDYAANIDLLKRLGGEKLGGQFSDVMTLRLDDGRPLIAHTGLVEILVDYANSHYGKGMVMGNTSTAVDTDKRVNEIMGMLTSAKPGDKQRYQSPEIQKELDALLAAQAKRQSK